MYSSGVVMMGERKLHMSMGALLLGSRSKMEVGLGLNILVGGRSCMMLDKVQKGSN